MLDHWPFLRAVAALPDDDLPRLVYADALEESGVPGSVARAHFIRKQIEMMRYGRGMKEFDRLYGEVEILLDKHSEDWITELKLPHPDEERHHVVYTWERGFIEGLFASWSSVMKLGSLLDIVPVRHLTLRRAEVTHYDTAGMPEMTAFLERIHTLRLNFADSFSDAILQLPATRNLHTLDLSDNPINDRALLQFAQHWQSYPCARSLRTLDLSRCSLITTAGIHSLASARGLERLDHLVIRGLHVPHKDLQILSNRMASKLIV